MPLLPVCVDLEVVCVLIFQKITFGMLYEKNRPYKVVEKDVSSLEGTTLKKIPVACSRNKIKSVWNKKITLLGLNSPIRLMAQQ